MRRLSCGSRSRRQTPWCSARPSTPAACPGASRTCSTGRSAAARCTASPWRGSMWPPRAVGQAPRSRWPACWDTWARLLSNQPAAALRSPGRRSGRTGWSPIPPSVPRSPRPSAPSSTPSARAGRGRQPGPAGYACGTFAPRLVTPGGVRPRPPRRRPPSMGTPSPGRLPRRAPASRPSPAGRAGG
jgi:hypothetical protein